MEKEILFFIHRLTSFYELHFKFNTRLPNREPSEFVAVQSNQLDMHGTFLIRHCLVCVDHGRGRETCSAVALQTLGENYFYASGNLDRALPASIELNDYYYSTRALLYDLP